MGVEPASLPEVLPAAPIAVIPREEPGWRRGFGTLLRLELRAWWGRPFWLIQSALWIVVVDGFLASVLSSGDTGPRLAMSDALFVAGNVFTGLGVIVLMQNAITCLALVGVIQSMARL